MSPIIRASWTSSLNSSFGKSGHWPLIIIITGYFESSLISAVGKCIMWPLNGRQGNNNRSLANSDGPCAVDLHRAEGPLLLSL